MSIKITIENPKADYNETIAVNRTAIRTICSALHVKNEQARTLIASGEFSDIVLMQLDEEARLTAALVTLFEDAL